jgi:DNA-binding NtrC family response regulator
VERKKGTPIYVPFLCHGISADEIEQTLFGRDKRQAGGSVESQPGLLEQAGEGTLYLNEIDEIPPLIQNEMLLALQNQNFRVPGSDRKVRVRCRIIVATEKNLTEPIQKGHFRRDLFYELHVIPIQIPPLRSRLEDIPELVGHTISRLASKGIEPKQLTPDAMAKLTAHEWPGNVRELKHCLERAALMASGEQIDRQDLSLDQVVSESAGAPVTGNRMKDYERRHPERPPPRRWKQKRSLPHPRNCHRHPLQKDQRIWLGVRHR